MRNRTKNTNQPTRNESNDDCSNEKKRVAWLDSLDNASFRLDRVVSPVFDIVAVAGIVGFVGDRPIIIVVIRGIVVAGRDDSEDAGGRQ
jgi:hypothetical protein